LFSRLGARRIFLVIVFVPVDLREC